MSLRLRDSRTDLICFPRVSGDEPYTAGYEPMIILFSPRERG